MASILLFFVQQWIKPFAQYGGDWHYVFLDTLSRGILREPDDAQLDARALPLAPAILRQGWLV